MIIQNESRFMPKNLLFYLKLPFHLLFSQGKVSSQTSLLLSFRYNFSHASCQSETRQKPDQITRAPRQIVSAITNKRQR